MEVGEGRTNEVSPFQGPQFGVNPLEKDCFHSFKSCPTQEKPSSLFMVLGWSSISIISFKSTCLIYLTGIAVLQLQLHNTSILAEKTRKTDRLDLQGSKRD
jgi:hypothetical protein